MDSEIKIFPCPNGEIQRVQVVRFEDWSRLDFLTLKYSPAALTCFADIYRRYLVPACPWIFGNMVMFHLPEDLEVPFPYSTRAYGKVADRLTAAAAALKQGVRVRGGKPVFRNEQVKNFWEDLESRGCLQIIRGKLPITTIIPVGDLPGYLTEAEREAGMKVNASFFIMDRFDCATVYDHVGTPLGLCVKNGVVKNPPLFGREALMVKRDGSVSVTAPELSDLVLEINGQRYRPGENARVYSRPEYARTPKTEGTQLVITGCHVAAVQEGGSLPVPASGFVLCPEGDCKGSPGDRVTYRGMEDILFGIQVGNSILRNGEVTTTFRSRFYNIRRLERVPFPPSLYPMNFNASRAARIALGADAAGKPVMLWAEGAGKLGHIPGQESCGATLADMARYCAAAGMVNAVNLDGGGSAQILLNNKRSLLISDRRPGDHAETERPVPLGLIVR